MIECFFYSKVKIDHGSSEFLGLFLDRMLHTSEENQSGSSNPNAWRAVLNRTG